MEGLAVLAIPLPALSRTTQLNRVGAAGNGTSAQSSIIPGEAVLKADEVADWG
jgi:hypothetical protein